MTQIKKITDKQGNDIYLRTHTKAVVDDNGYTAESRLQAMQDEINQAQLAVGAVPSDLTPTENSTNWVTSGGLYPIKENVNLYGQCLANCIHNDGEDVDEDISLKNGDLVNGEQNWGTNPKRIALKSTSLIDVQDSSKVILSVPYNAISDSNIDRCSLPMYDANKTYLTSLDLGWYYFSSNDVTITVDLTNSNYSSVVYVGCYFGSNNIAISPSSIDASKITFTLTHKSTTTTKAVDENGLATYLNNYDILANCHHTNQSESSTYYISSYELINADQAWVYTTARIVLIKDALISVGNANGIKLYIPYTAISSHTIIDRCQMPFYGENKEYLGGLDMGWVYFNGNDVTINIDLTQSQYRNVYYVGVYFGSKNKNLTQVSIDTSGIVFTTYNKSEYTTKAVDEEMFNNAMSQIDVRTMLPYYGQKIELSYKFDYNVLFNMPSYSQNRQGADIYGDYLFQFFDTNAFMQIWNVRTKALIQTITLQSDSNNHSAGVSFGDFYDSSDTFPLVYVAAFNSNYIYVYRFTGELGNMSASLIQTITIDSSLMYLPNMTIDKYNKKMILYGYKTNSYSDASGNSLKFAVVDVPSTAGDTSITASNIIKQYDLPFRYAAQDSVAIYGKMLFYWGYAANSTFGSGMMQIDYINGIINSEAYLNSMLNNEDEIQGVGIWDGNIITTSYLGNVRTQSF